MVARGWARLRWEYRYYFVRRKAPLSSILWHRVLGRRYNHSGVHPLSVAWIGRTPSYRSLAGHLATITRHPRI